MHLKRNFTQVLSDNIYPECATLVHAKMIPIII